MSLASIFAMDSPVSMAVELAIERTRIFRAVAGLRRWILAFLSDFLIMTIILPDFRSNENTNLF